MNIAYRHAPVPCATHREAGSNGRLRMKASIDDVAAKAGVSTATVSRAFSHPEKVSPKTRDKVLKAAEQLDFSISRSAGVLKSGKSYRIALLVGNSRIEWFTASIIEGLNAIFREAGYDLVIYPIAGVTARAEFFDDLPVRGNADAVIVSSFDISQAEAERLGTAHVPIIGINCATSRVLSASVGIDDAYGIRLAVRHLAALGHRNIAYVYKEFSPGLKFSSGKRITGFTHACAEIAGMKGKLIPVSPADTAFDTAISGILGEKNPPTAICFHQDSIAVPFFFRLRETRISVPEDISIIGFDDSTFARDIGLTTIRQLPREMAASAAHKALSLIEKQPVEDPHRIFPTQLIIRNSTARPRKTGKLLKPRN